MSKLTAQHTSKSVEWYTPEEVMRPIRKYLGARFLDPASCEAANKHLVRASKFFTEDDNALNRQWPKMPVFLNPPGGTRTADEEFPTRSSAAAWLLKMGRHMKVTKQRGIYLCFNINMLTTLHALGVTFDSIVIPSKRIRFVDAEGYQQTSPPHGNAIIGWGDQERFKECFDNVGMILQPYDVE